METVNTSTKKIAYKAVSFSALTIACLLFEETFGQIMLEKPSETGARWLFGIITLLQTIAGCSVLIAIVFTRDLYRLWCAWCASNEQPDVEHTPNNTETTKKPRYKLYLHALIFIVLTVGLLKLEEVFAEILILGKPTPDGASWLFHLINTLQLIAGYSVIMAGLCIYELNRARSTDIADPATDNSQNVEEVRGPVQMPWQGVAISIAGTIGCLALEQVVAGNLILGNPTPTGIKWLFRLVMILQLVGGLIATLTVTAVYLYLTPYTDKVKQVEGNNPSGARTSNAEQV